MKYRLKIEERGSDEAETVCVTAEGDYACGELKLKYVFDGADYALTVGKDYTYHERFGDTFIKLIFREGQATKGTLSGEGLNAELIIFTHELKIILTENGCSVRVTYSDGEDTSRKVVKNVTAYAV